MGMVELLSEKVIKVPLQSRDKKSVIRELVTLLGNAGLVSDTEAVIQAVTEREALGSTGLGMSIAVPHAKSTKVNNLCMALGIAPNGIDFDALDGEDSKLFFMIIAPPDQSNQHIQVLTEIAGLAKSNTFCKLLCQAESVQEVLDIFKED